MTEKTAEIDQLKGATLEDISAMVESINREFKNKQQQLQPLIGELKVKNAHKYTLFDVIMIVFYLFLFSTIPMF